MEILFSKVATRLILPLGIVLGAQALGLVAWGLGRRRVAAALLLLGWALLLSASLPVVAQLGHAALERLYLPEPVEAMPEADAILLLGGGMGPALPPRLTPDLGPAADRVLHAARLHRAGKAPVVIAAGGSMPWRPEGSEGGTIMAFQLREWGVPDEAIVEETRSRNTYENCREAAAIARGRGIERILLVTSALHMRRSLATCRTAGLTAIPAPTDFNIVEDDEAGTPLAWLPDAMSLVNTTEMIREVIGYEVYRWRGWIDPDVAAAPPHEMGAGARPRSSSWTSPAGTKGEPPSGS